MSNTNLGDHITQMEAERNYLLSKSESDDGMIALLKQQLELAEMTNSKLAADHAEELRVLRMQRDQAVRVAKEVKSILDTAAAGIVSGMRKMAGDETPAARPAALAPPTPAAVPEPEPPSKAVVPRNEFPVEVARFAPPRLRPASTDEVDVGLAELVGQIASSR